MSIDVTERAIHKAEQHAKNFWEWFWENPMANLFDGLVIPCVMLLAIGVTARSFRNNCEVTAQPVIRIPFLHVRIETAHILAVSVGKVIDVNSAIPDQVG